MYSEDRKGHNESVFKATKRNHNLTSRAFASFLNNERIFIVDKCTLIHGAKSSQDEPSAKADVEERSQKQGKKIMYLSPNVYIEKKQKSNVVKLRVLPWSDKLLKTSYLKDITVDKLPEMKWHKCGRVFSKDNCAKFTAITFENEDEAKQWEAYLRESQLAPKMPSDFYHSHKLTEEGKKLYKELDCSIWRMILSDDKKSAMGIRSFFFNLTTGTKKNRSGDLEPVTNGAYGAVFSRLQDLSVKLRAIDKNAADNGRKMRGFDATTIREDDDIDVEIFCYLLHRISMNKLDRLLLLISNFTSEYYQIDEDETIEWYSEKENETYWEGIKRDSIRVIHAFLSRDDEFMMGAEKSGKKNFKELIEESIYNILSVCSDIPEEYSLHGQKDQPLSADDWDAVAYWYRHEVEIFRTLGVTGSANLLEISPTEIDLAMKSPIWILHALMTQIFFRLQNISVEYVEPTFGRESSTFLDYDEDDDLEFNENDDDNEVRNSIKQESNPRKKRGSRLGTTINYTKIDLTRKDIIKFKSKQIVDIYKNLPIDFLLLEFDAKLSPNSSHVMRSPHMINCLFLFPPDKQHEIFQHFIRNHSISGELYRAFLEQAFLLTIHSTRAEESMMKHMLDITGWLLFNIGSSEKERYFDQFSQRHPHMFAHEIVPGKLKFISDVAVIIIETIMKFYNHQAFSTKVDLNDWCMLLAIAFRIETLDFRMQSRREDGSHRLFEFSKTAKKPSSWITARRTPEELYTFQNMILGKPGHDGFNQFLLTKMHEIEQGIDLDWIEASERRFKDFRLEIMYHILYGMFVFSIEQQSRKLERARRRSTLGGKTMSGKDNGQEEEARNFTPINIFQRFLETYKSPYNRSIFETHMSPTGNLRHVLLVIIRSRYPVGDKMKSIMDTSRVYTVKYVDDGEIDPSIYKYHLLESKICSDVLPACSCGAPPSCSGGGLPHCSCGTWCEGNLCGMLPYCDCGSLPVCSCGDFPACYCGGLPRQCFGVTPSCFCRSQPSCEWEPHWEPSLHEVVRVDKASGLPREAVIKKISNQGLMGSARHYAMEAIDLLTLASGQDPYGLTIELIMVALRLKNYSNMRERVNKIRGALTDDTDVKKPLLQEMCKKLIVCEERAILDGSKTFELETITDSLNASSRSLRVLDGLNNEKLKLKDLLSGYIRNYDPFAWEGLFKGSYSVAKFLKYAGRENLQFAYDCMYEENKMKRDAPLNPDGDDITKKRLRFLLEHSKRILPENQAVVSKEQIDEIMNNQDADANIFDTAIREIEGRGRSQVTEDGKLLYELTVAWIKLRNEGKENKLKVIMPPRNIQLINMLCITNWIKIVTGYHVNDLFKDEKDRGKCLITQVGTGEGKSVTIAFIAVYCVKILGFNVHILENNEGLLDKDFQDMESFYNSYFGISVGKANDRIKGPPEDPDHELQSKQVIYCTVRGMLTMYKSGVGLQPFKNTVLIVDEVDDLIVDRNPNEPFAMKSDAKSREMEEAFKALRDGRDPPRSDVSSAMWKKCKSVKKKFDSNAFIEERDYTMLNGRYVVMRDGNADVNISSPMIEYVNFIKLGKSPVEKVQYFYLSIPHVMNSYRCIVGLSGSTGSTSEKQFLSEVYGAWIYVTPSFLSTCQDDQGKRMEKPKAKLLNKEVIVCTTTEKQVQRVADLAVEFCQKVPVLILCPYQYDVIDNNGVREYKINKKNTRKEQEKIKKKIEDLISKDKKSFPIDGELPSDQIVQLFSKQDENGVDLHWKDLVHTATKDYQNANVFLRHITVSDPFGGRGFDFDVQDDYAQSQGGMLVIAMSIPAEREWIQWKGRTARSDRFGQLAIILSKEENTMSKMLQCDEALKQKLGIPNYYNEVNYVNDKPKDANETSIIVHILSYHDSSTEEKLAKQGMETRKGQRLNEMCDNYHSYYRSLDSPNCFFDWLTISANKVGGFCNLYGNRTIKNWPRLEYFDTDRQLQLFLESTENSNEKIKEFMIKVGLPDVPSKYKDHYNEQVPPREGPPSKRISILLDYSGSMTFTNDKENKDSGIRIKTALDCIENFIDEYCEEQDYIMLWTFTHKEPNRELDMTPLKGNGNKIKEKVRACNKPSGGTCFNSALHKLIESVKDRGGENNLIIALTDGETSDTKTALDKTISGLKDKDDISLFLLGLGSDVSNPQGQCAQNFDDIKKKFIAKEKKAKIALASDMDNVARAFDEANSLVEIVELST